MGRKIKPRHLKRDRISISLDIDSLRFLDKTAERTGGTRSRFIESLIKSRMLKGQASLSGFLYRCKICRYEGQSSKENLTWCRNCSEASLFCAGTMSNFQRMGEEE